MMCYMILEYREEFCVAHTSDLSSSTVQRAVVSSFHEDMD